MKMGVRLSGVSRSFGAGNSVVHALRSISVFIPHGRMVVVAGPSGSGKTTLLGVVGGIESPDSGCIEVAGMEIGGLSERELSRYRRVNVGFAFQESSLFNELTIGENIELPLFLNQMKSTARRQRVRRLLERLGLADRIRAMPVELSVGEQHRVALARAVAHHPSLILADEPTANLDSANLQEVVKLLNQIHEEEEVTVLLATHDLRVIEMVEARIFLRDGAIESTEGLPAA